MSMLRVDLYLGGDLALWVLEHISLDHVKNVFTLDENIVRTVQNCNVSVWLGNANSLDFEAAEIGFSVHYPRILKGKLISKYLKIYNLHPGYLPWGRGYYPVFWALWEQTPAGATLHEITTGIDEGPIVAQIKVECYPHDTGGSLHERVRESEKILFLEYWPKITSGERIPSFPQPEGGTYHSKKEFFELKQQAKWQSMTSVDLVRLIRALTFPGYSGLEITLGNRKFAISLEPLES